MEMVKLYHDLTGRPNGFKANTPAPLASTVPVGRWETRTAVI